MEVKQTKSQMVQVLTGLTIKQLQTKLRNLGLSASGKKSVLIDRIICNSTLDEESCNSSIERKEENDNLSSSVADKLAKLQELELEIKILKAEQEVLKLKQNTNENTQINSFKQWIETANQNHTISSLPRPEPPIFDGDPLQYPRWKAAFTTLIDSRNIPEADKIYYLHQYLKGSPLKAVETLPLSNDLRAYNKALQIIDERYGNKFVISHAFKANLKTWSKIKNTDSVRLQEFGDFLESCALTKRNISGLAVLDDDMQIQELVRILPDWAMSKWSDYADEYRFRNDDYPQFDEFVKFTSRMARKANDPVTSMNALKGHTPSIEIVTPGKSSLRTPSHGSNQIKKFNNTTSYKIGTHQQNMHHVEMKSKSNSCQKCQTNQHKTAECPELMKLKLYECQRFIRNSGLCFNCLMKGHVISECNSEKLVCGVCHNEHATILHKMLQEKITIDNEHQLNKNGATTQQVSANQINSQNNVNVSTMIVPVHIVGATGENKMTYALIDTQSDASFITESLAEHLGQGEHCELCVSTMTSYSQRVKTVKYRNVEIKGIYSNKLLVIPTVFTRPHIPVDRSHIPTPESARRWTHLQQIADKISPLRSCSVGLLIGYNCADASAPRQVIAGGTAEPYAIETDLGWSVVGGTQEFVGSDARASMCETHRIQCHEKQLESSAILKRLEEEFHDVDSESEPRSQDDLLFQEIIATNVEIVHGHYTMPLPFKSRPVLPINRESVLKRFCSLLTRFKHNPLFMNKYKVFMDDIIANGEAELVEKPNDSDNVWYIPHHGVESSKKPDKIRVVFDCSAQYKGQSLNGHLLQGPNYNNNLCGVLCRFRQEPIAVTCDIKKMYHQFRVRTDDRDFLRFLWLKDDQIQDYRMTVHVFGACSSPSVACFGLKQLAKDNKDVYPAAARFVENHFYVDDGLVSVRTSDEAIGLMKETITMCSKANLTLHKFISNDPHVTTALTNNKQMQDSDNSIVKRLICRDGMTDKALGVVWNTINDSLSLAVECKQIKSRRDALSLVASVYDPLGLITPFTFRAKHMLQLMCKERVSWDDPIPLEQQLAWKEWCQDLGKIHDIQVPRCIKPQFIHEKATVELHVFSDASTIGYGACAYLKFNSHLGQLHHTRLVMSKNRVSPLKAITVPRLELQASVLGVKLAKFLQKELDYDDVRTVFWTDSKTVLGYISNDARKFHTFVCNRIQQIRNASEPTDWHYVPSQMNPADLISRGCSMEELVKSEWFEEPTILKEHHAPDYTPSLDPTDPEIKMVRSLASETKSKPHMLDRLMRLSTLKAMLRVLVLLKKAAHKRCKLPDFTETEVRQWAMDYIVKMIQQVAFQEEISLLQNGLSIHKSSKLGQLDPYLDQNSILRIGGRLEYSRYNETFKHPKILPNNHPLTRVFCEHFHRQIAHQGRNTTLNHMRANGFHILRGTRLVSSVINDCVTCRKLRGHLITQKMANLPDVRAEEVPPFSHVGYDCFGPLVVKEGRRDLKRYGVVFTCMSSRAVHIELCDDLSADSFINSLRNLIALRGPVSTMRSDRGSNFVGASQELKRALEEMDNETIRKFLAVRQCQFLFNTPSASHMGGCWERMIRTIRQVLEGLLFTHRGRLDSSSLRTLLYEVMAIVNSRPITTLHTDHHSQPEPLTPNHILTMKVAQALPPPGSFVEADVYSRKRWRRVQALATMFWSRWRHEFLSTLQKRSKWNTKQINLKVNDIVIMSDDNPIRQTWKLARVVRTHPSNDGLVRTITVYTSDRHTLVRPVHKCILLTS